MTSRKWAVAIVASAVVVGLLAPGGLASTAFGPKVDDRVAAVAEAGSDGGYVNVLVGGSNPAAAVQAVKGLDLVGLGSSATSAQVPLSALESLASDPRVDFVAPDLPSFPSGGISPSSNPGIPYASIDNAPAAWAAGYKGSGVGIAVIDSGVGSTNLSGRLVQVPLTKNQDPKDYYGHGTFVANVAAGVDNAGWFKSVAPGARIVSFKVATGDGARTGT